MPDTGWLLPGTAAQDTIADAQAWTSPDNITADDDAQASCNSPYYGGSNWLRATNFGAAVPSGATIKGVAIEIDEKASNGSAIYIADIHLWTGSKAGTSKTNQPDWPTSFTKRTYGGATDLWGATLTATNVNATSFGVRFKVAGKTTPNTYAFCDVIRVKIYYDMGPGWTALMVL